MRSWTVSGEQTRTVSRERLSRDRRDRDEESTKAALEQLGKEKGVVAVDAVTRQYAFRAPNDSFFEELWGFQAIGAELAGT